MWTTTCSCVIGLRTCTANGSSVPHSTSRNCRWFRYSPESFKDRVGSVGDHDRCTRTNENSSTTNHVGLNDKERGLDIESGSATWVSRAERHIPMSLASPLPHGRQSGASGDSSLLLLGLRQVSKRPCRAFAETTLRWPTGPCAQALQEPAPHRPR